MFSINSLTAIIVLYQTKASEDCTECDTFTWDNCYWDWEAQWNECSWVWDEDNGVEPYDKQCAEELVLNQKDCLDAAGCFEPNNEHCWYNNYVFGCYLYNCEQYTLCYKSYQTGCNETRDFCQESCGVDTADDDSYSYSMSFENEDYEPWYNDDSFSYDDSYNWDDSDSSDYDDSYDYDDGADYDDSYEYDDESCHDGYCGDYNDYDDSNEYNNDDTDYYGDYDDGSDCDCGDGVYYDCCGDYNYDDYDYYYYDQEPWQYTYDEVPDCIKNNCDSALMKCSESGYCESAIEQIVDECGNSGDTTVCVEDLFVNTAQDNKADERLQSFCDYNDECVEDIKSLGECVVNNECHEGDDKLVRKRLKSLVKGLKKLRKQKLKLKSERGKEARIKSAKRKSAKRKLAKRKLVKKQQRKRSRKTLEKQRKRRKTGRRSRRKLVSKSRGRRGERVRLRKDRRSKQRVQRHRAKQQKLRGNRGKRVRASRRNKAERVRGRGRERKVFLGELSSKQRDALKKQTAVFSKEKRSFYQQKTRKQNNKQRPNPTPAHLQREQGVPKRKREIKKRESSLRNAAKSE